MSKFAKVVIGGAEDLLPIVDPAAADPIAIYDFLQVNGFIYRCNKVSGEMWRLEAHATEKKTQVWKKIEELTEAIQ